MSHDTRQQTRRTVLKTVGGALGVASVAGIASAEATTDDLSPGQCVYAYDTDEYATVYTQCAGGSTVGRVPNHTFGRVEQVCELYDGTDWGYVVWDDDSPDGWVSEDELRPCITPNQ